MSYPEPIPAVRGKKNVEEFLRRLENFRLTDAQKELYRGARKAYLTERNR